MKDFYLTLLSDSSTNYFPTNKQGSFTVRLERPIYIDKDNWEVALVEIITPSQVINITEENNFFFLRFYNPETVIQLNPEKIYQTCDDRRCKEAIIYIPKGNYESPQLLTQEIESAIEEEFGDVLKKLGSEISISYGAQLRRVKMYIKKDVNVKIRFPVPLSEKLGLDPRLAGKPIGKLKHIFRYGVDLNTAHNQLYVYSDVADYTFVGDVTAPILRVIPFKTIKDAHHVHQEFLNLHYVPVAKSFIDQVHVSIKGDTGEDILFLTGKTLIKLHFRHKQS